MRKVVLALVLLATPAIAQPAPPPFVPIVIDAARYQELDAAISKLSMPRDAHAALLNILQQLERQARIDQAQKAEPPTKP